MENLSSAGECLGKFLAYRNSHVTLTIGVAIWHLTIMQHPPPRCWLSAAFPKRATSIGMRKYDLDKNAYPSPCKNCAQAQNPLRVQRPRRAAPCSLPPCPRCAHTLPVLLPVPMPVPCADGDAGQRRWLLAASEPRTTQEFPHTGHKFSCA